MVDIFGRAALHFHSITIVEAVACGVHSVLSREGTVGTSVLIGEDSSLQVSMPPTDENYLSKEAVEAIVNLLIKDEDRLESLSAKAKQRALAWDEVAYGEKLLEIMTRVSA
jgi:hypothetical protein